MKKKLFKNGISIGIVFLFIGLSIGSSISGYSEKMRNSVDYDFLNSSNEQIILNDGLPEEQWNITFGGQGIEYGEEVQQTSDSGFIIVGDSFDDYNHTSEVILCKVDACGNIEWNKTFEGEGADWSSGFSVKQCLDGGYIVVGETELKESHDYVLWLFKTDANGNLEWNKTFGTYCDEHGLSVVITSDGGFLIVGVILMDWESLYEIWLIKTDVEGNEEWNKTLGGISNDDMGFAGQQTTDDGFIITGSTATFPFENYDVLLIKTDVDGNEVWSKTFGGFDYDEGWDVYQTVDGGYIITGLTESYGSGSGDIWLIKTDVDGNKIWDKTYGGKNYDWGISGHQTIDNGYIITGLTESYGAGDGDLWLIKTDVDGNLDWSETFGGEDFDIGSSVQQTSEEGYIITGGTVSYGTGDEDIWLIKIIGINQPPDKPVIKGLTGGKVGKEYEYSFVTIEPDGDEIYYELIDWDDGTPIVSIGPYYSGEKVIFKHKWLKEGVYTIRALARDIYCTESEWGTFKVTIPRTRAIYSLDWLSFLEGFPILQKILLSSL